MKDVNTWHKGAVIASRGPCTAVTLPIKHLTNSCFLSFHTSVIHDLYKLLSLSLHLVLDHFSGYAVLQLKTKNF